MTVSCQISKMFNRFSWLTLIMVGLIVAESVTEKSYEKVLTETVAIPSSSLEITSELPIPYHEEYKVFEKDYPKRRKKRFIYYNVDSNLDVGFLCIIPVSIALPQMSNLFNKWRKRRSIRSVDEMEEIFEDHPIVQANLDRIGMYFQLVDIPEHHCQLRAICEFSAEPSKYFPLSDLVISRLRDPSIPWIVFEFNENGSDSIHEENNSTVGESRPKSLFKSYNTAADDGLAYGSERCQTNYGGQCKYSMDKLLSMTAFRIWSAMRSQIGFNVRDNNFKF